MLTWIENTIHQLGYFGILLLMAVENLFPPLPSEFIMPLAGFVTAQGKLTFTGVVAAGTLGATAGSMVLFGLGRSAGTHRIRRWVQRYGHWFLLSEDDLDRAHAWFHRYGAAAVLLCRLVPGVRSLISIPAGLAQMHTGLYLAYTVAGSLVWTWLLTYAGKALGDNYRAVETALGPVSYGVLALAVTLGLVWYVRRRRALRQASLERRRNETA